MFFKKKIYKLLRTIIYLFFIVVFISPIFIMISTSLKTYYEITIWPPTFFGKSLEWKNYKDILFGNKNIILPLVNTFIISISSSLICISLGILAAYSVSRYNFKLKNTFLVLIIITQMFTAVVLSVPMYIIFQSLNLLNTRISLIISNTAVSLPMTVWLLYSYLENIPKDLEEAAWIDGCSRIQSIKYIICPLVLPGVITAGLFAFISSWSDVLFSNAFITSSEMNTISIALSNFQSLYKTSWHTQMAASFISTIPTFIIFAIIQKHIINSLTSSGIKG